MLRTRKTRPRLHRALLGVGLGAILLVGNALPAHADAYAIGVADASLLPDDLIEDYCLSGRNWGANPFAVDLVNIAMANLDAQTDLTARSRSCGPNTDIVFVLSTTTPADPFDRVRCTKRWQSYCDQNVATVNMAQLTSGTSTPEVNALKAMCWVVGNAVGLLTDYFDTGGHDCMMFEHGPIPNWHVRQMTSYSDHHVAHINSRAVAYG